MNLFSLPHLSNNLSGFTFCVGLRLNTVISTVICSQKAIKTFLFSNVHLEKKTF